MRICGAYKSYVSKHSVSSCPHIDSIFHAQRILLLEKNANFDWLLSPSSRRVFVSLVANGFVCIRQQPRMKGELQLDLLCWTVHISLHDLKSKKKIFYTAKRCSAWNTLKL